LHEKLSKAQREYEILQQKKTEIEEKQKHLNEQFMMLKASLA
jgi:hypothetical protein